jgi:S1-C subfamily serine protease
MRKLWIVGGFVLAALTLMVGVIFAQEDESETTTAWLGVRVVEQDDAVIVARVQSGSPADSANLFIGDEIVSFAGTAINTAASLNEQLQQAAPGDTVTLELLRNGASTEVEVTLGTQPVGIGGKGFGRGWDLPTDALSAAEMLLHADLEETEAGFEVVAVITGRNPFALEVGDIVNSVNGQAVAELDVEALISEFQTQPAEMTVVLTREGEEITSTASLAAGRGGRGMGMGRGGRGGLRFEVPNFDTPDSATPEVTPEDTSTSL